ncbi:hypothetical protein D3C87_1658360 [compost metagenome]
MSRIVSPPIPQMLIAVIPSPGSIAARPLARRTVICRSRPFSRTVRSAEWNGVKATSPATAATMAPRRINATGR